MIELKVSLKPRNAKPINKNYRIQLERLCKEFIDKYHQENVYNQKLQEFVSGQAMEEVYYKVSELKCEDFEITGNNILFKNDVSWCIDSNSYELISSLVQGLFRTESITIDKAIFDICHIETLKV